MCRTFRVMEHKMPENDVWPPKPTLPDPQTEYDDWIEAKLPTLSAVPLSWDLLLPPQHRFLPGFGWLFRKVRPFVSEEPADNRVKLIQVLQEERGLDWWQAHTVMRGYNQRHETPAAKKAALKPVILAFTGLALTFAALLANFVAMYLTFHRDAVLRQPNHGAALRALDNAKSFSHIVSFGLLALVYGFWIIRYWVMRRRMVKPDKK